MKSLRTQAIILRRIKYAEADMIITLLTPDQGKIRVIAKGVRKSTSKLAGGIELFSQSDISFLPGKGDVSTLVSSRLIIFYKNIVENLDKTTIGYEIIKVVDKASYDGCEREYYDILEQSLKELNAISDTNNISISWVYAQLAKTLGHTPNLSRDSMGNKLIEGQSYSFDFNSMHFSNSRGDINGNDIKLLRLLFDRPLDKLTKINNIEKSLIKLEQLLKTMLSQYL